MAWADYLGNPYIFGIVALLELLVLFAAVSFWTALGSVRRSMRNAAKGLPRTKQEVRGKLPEVVRLDFDHWISEGVELEGQTYRPAELSSFFDPQTILQRVEAFPRLRYDLATHLSSTATGIGILGTFTGVALSLGHLSGSTSAGLTENIPAVIQSLAAAFTTSIVGVAVAIFVNLLLSSREGGLRAAVERLDTELRIRFPALTPSVLIHHLEARVRQESEHARDRHDRLRQDLEEAGSNIRMIAQDVTERLTEGIDNALRAQLGPALQKLNSLVEGQLASARDDASEQVRTFLDEAIGSLRGSFEQMGHGVSEAAGRFEQVIGNVSEVMSSVDSSANAQRELLSQQQEALQAAFSTAQESSQRMAQVSDSAAVLAKLGEQVGQLQEGLATSMSEQAKERDEMVSASRQIVQSIQQAQVGYQQGAQYLERVAPAFREAVKESANELNVAASGFSEASRETTEAIRGISEKASEVADALGSAMRQLEARVQAERSLVEQFGTVHRELTKSLQAVQPVVGELSRAAAEVSKREGTASQTLQQLTTLSNSLTNSVKSLDENLRSASSAMSEATSGLQKSLQAHEEWTDRSVQAVETFGERLGDASRRSFGEIDGALSVAVGHLSHHLKELEELLDNFEPAPPAARRG